MLRTPAILSSFAFRGAPSPFHAHEGAHPKYIGRPECKHSVVLCICYAGESLPHAESFKHSVDDVVGDGFAEDLGERGVGVGKVRSQKLLGESGGDALIHQFERAESLPEKRFLALVRDHDFIVEGELFGVK